MKPSDLKVYADQIDELGFDELASFLRERAEILCDDQYLRSPHGKATVDSYLCVGGRMHGRRVPLRSELNGGPRQNFKIPSNTSPFPADPTTWDYETETYHLEAVRVGATIITYYRHQDHEGINVLYDLLMFDTEPDTSD